MPNTLHVTLCFLFSECVFSNTSNLSLFLFAADQRSKRPSAFKVLSGEETLSGSAARLSEGDLYEESGCDFLLQSLPNSLTHLLFINNF